MDKIRQYVSVKCVPFARMQIGRLRVHWKYVVGGLLFVVMLIQLLYPSSRMTPHTYLGELPIGMKTKQAVRDDLVNRQKSIVIQFNGKPTSFDPISAGIGLDVEKTVENLPTLSWAERAIPLWPFIKAIPKQIVQPVITRDQEKITKFAATLATEQHREPINATAEVKEGSLQIHEATEGEEYSSELIKNALSNNDPFYGPAIQLQPKFKAAAVYAKDLDSLRGDFMQATLQPLKISYGNTTKEFDTKAVAGLLAVVIDPATNKPRIDMNPATLEPLLQEWNREYTVAPGTAQLSTLDNVETSRKTGPSGRALDIEGVKKQLSDWVKKPVSNTVVLATKVLPPKVVVTRTYSQSSAGLLAKLKFWLETHAGSYQVAIRELGGQGREASYNVSQQTVMASTYKPFLAFVAYRQAESGALNLGAGLVNGKNIEQCIEVMIVNSDNDCAVALGKYIGWAKVDQIILANGFSNVHLNNYDANGNLNGDKLVNATEQANFLAQLSNGSLVNQLNTSRLLGYMKRQIYRDGIPAGSQGAIVADKVGFLEGYIHDVGIVYSPKATYALVIMSQGSNWGNIKDLSAAVYEFMNE